MNLFKLAKSQELQFHKFQEFISLHIDKFICRKDIQVFLIKKEKEQKIKENPNISKKEYHPKDFWYYRFTL